MQHKFYVTIPHVHVILSTTITCTYYIHLYRTILASSWLISYLKLSWELLLCERTYICKQVRRKFQQSESECKFDDINRLKIGYWVIGLLMSAPQKWRRFVSVKGSDIFCSFVCLWPSIHPFHRWVLRSYLSSYTLKSPINVVSKK